MRWGKLQSTRNCYIREELTRREVSIRGNSSSAGNREKIFSLREIFINGKLSITGKTERVRGNSSLMNTVKNSSSLGNLYHREVVISGAKGLSKLGFRSKLSFIKILRLVHFQRGIPFCA